MVKTEKQDAPPARMIRDYLFWDNHVCLPKGCSESWMIKLLQHKQAGFDVVSVNVGDGDDGYEDQLAQANLFRNWFEHQSAFRLVNSVRDIVEARRRNQLGVLFDVEGLHGLNSRKERIEQMYSLGVRWASIAYNTSNEIGGGCHYRDAGLTPFGIDVIEEMDRVGIVKCCSHTGYRTSLDVFNNTDKPTIFSHSNCYELAPHDRNVRKEQIYACAATGGVIGVNGISLFLGGDDVSSLWLEHVDAIVQLVGVDHVGISLDFIYDQLGLKKRLKQGSSLWPSSSGYTNSIRFLPPGSLCELLSGLSDRGYRESDIRKIAGENWLRVARLVWKS